MHRIAIKMVGNIDDVPDIVQEIFIDFFNKTTNGNIIYNPKSWLYKATINKCVDKLRKRKKFLPLEILAAVKSEEVTIECQELKAAMDLAISKLKPRERLLAVFYSEGLSYKELTEVTGIKYSSLGKVIFRTLRKIEKELRNQHYELY